MALSAVGDDGVGELLPLLERGVTAVMLGPSGVGKSTLANRLLGEERLAVSRVRAGDAKGRHTTSHRELVALPSGACLIDTPGVHELGLWLAAGAVDSAFPEIEKVAARCRFRDCQHETEPGCTVAAAVEAGEIDGRRLDSYHRLRREDDSSSGSTPPAATRSAPGIARSARWSSRSSGSRTRGKDGDNDWGGQADVVQLAVTTRAKRP